MPLMSSEPPQPVRHQSRMFSFITETWNPFRGRCPYECSYCWARGMAKRYKHLKEKYFTDEQGIDEKQINRRFKPGAFIFVQDMSDASTASFSDVERVKARVVENPEATFLFLSKNPAAYIYWLEAGEWPQNTIFGATVETGIESVLRRYSKAPPPFQRLEALYELSLNDYRTFISIEPIMDFDRGPFLKAINIIRPWAVAVGYDNYRNGLPEPPLSKTLSFIEDLEKRGITVYRKTLREANDKKEKTCP